MRWISLRDDPLWFTAMSRKKVAAVGGGGIDGNTICAANFNGTDGAQTYTDETTLVWTVGAGGAGENELDTAQKKFGSASLYLPSTSNASANVTIDLAATTWADDWTIEFFFRGEDGATSTFSIADLVAGDAHTLIDLIQGAAALSVSFTHNKKTNVQIVNISDTPAADALTWHHVAIVYDASEAIKFSLYVNGVRLQQGNSDGGLSDYILTSLSFSTGQSADLWIDGLRFSTAARYSGATYTVPTAEWS